MKESNFRLAIILISLALAILLINVFFWEKKSFEDLALGEETQRYQATEGGKVLHIVDINEHDENNMLRGWNERGRKPVVLILGNSQSHSINQMKQREVSYVQLLHDTLKSENVDVLCNSFPNASLQEFLLLLEYWREKLPVQAVVVPLFMDDFRETGLRSFFIKNIKNSRFILKDTQAIIEKQINQQLRIIETAENEDADADTKALKSTVQESVEKRLNEWLGNHSNTWRNRENIRGELFTGLYVLRNSVFNISASTKRKMIPSRYNDNMEALKSIIAICKRDNINLVIYIPPIRNDLPIPYDETEYNLFKTQIAAFQSTNVTVKNFENIVPGQYWGAKNATTAGGSKEIDYMHFQYQGPSEFSRFLSLHP